MRKLIQIGWLHLKTTYQNRSTLLFGLLLPLVFTYIVGLGIQGFEPDNSPVAWPVSVVNADTGAFSAAFIELLESDEILAISQSSEADALESLAAESTSAVLFIPADFSAKLDQAQPQSLEFHTNLSEPLSAQIVERAVLVSLNRLSHSVDIAASSLSVADQLGLFELSAQGAPSSATYYADSLDQAIGAWTEASSLPATVTANKVTLREDVEVTIPNGFQQTSPGMAVIFAMFFIVAGAGALLQEREQGTLSRLLLTPVRKGTILGGKLLGVFAAGILQITIMILAGQFLFGVDWGAQPLALALLIFSFCFMVTSLAVLMSALVRSYAQLDAISTILIMTLSGLGGAMWPIEIVPDFMQRLQLFTPTGWAMQGFHDIITRGLGVQEILLECGVLMLFALVFLFFGIRFFSYE